MKKLLCLFFAFLLPVLIFFFLKAFGKNEFDVPVLFTDSVTTSGVCSAYVYQTPYTIVDSTLQKTSWSKNDSLTIFVFEGSDKAGSHERKIHLTRIFDQFKTEPLHVVHVYKDSMLPDLKVDRLTTVSFREDDFMKIRNCIFLLSPDTDAVIIDSKKRIRGQYNLTKREDADRMIMEEMNILLKRY